MSVSTRSNSFIDAQSDGYLLIPFALVAILCAFLTNTRTLAVTILSYGLFALPGFIIFRYLTASIGRAMVYGIPLGCSITSLLVLVVVGIAGWDIPVILSSYILGLGLLAVLIWFCRLRRAGSTSASSEEPALRLPLIVVAAIGIAAITLFIPFYNAGKLTSEGYAFTGLFGHDFILRSVDSVALANGIPSDLYYINGVKTHNYYILWYILPATIYNLLGKQAEIRGIVSVVSLLSIPTFCALVYYTLAIFIRKITNGPHDTVRLSLIFVALLLFSYSYHWLFFALTQIVDVTSVNVLVHLSKQMSPVSNSWYKDFLFQPHTILALMQVIVLMHLASGPPFRLRGAGLGLLLASLLLTDTVVFLIAGSAFGIWCVLNGSARSRISEFFVIVVTVAALVALAFALRIFIVPEYSNRILFTPYVAVIVSLPIFLIFVLGPLPVVALLGEKEKVKGFAEERWFLVILLFTSLFFMLFVTEELEGNVFLRKSLMILRLPLFILGASYLYTSSLDRIKKLSLLLLILASPTLATDVYATSNTRNKQYTTYVTAEEMAGASWIKTHTAPDAVVQSLIEYAGVFDYSLTICFGERKAALGLWKMAYQRYPNRNEITRRVHMIETVFASDDAEERYRIVRALHIDYVLVGPRERARFPRVSGRFDADALHFKQVYTSENVKIYQVRL